MDAEQLQEQARARAAKAPRARLRTSLQDPKVRAIFDALSCKGALQAADIALAELDA